MPHFKIDIISDVVCPWCYIGSRRLNKAIDLFTKTHPAGRTSTFAIKWHAFYLDPTAPEAGIPLAERMAQKFGGHERVNQMQTRLAGIGARSGITFNFNSRIGRTRTAHRLIEVAGASDDQKAAFKAEPNAVSGRPETLQDRVVQGLFEGYFEQGHDITDQKWIESIGRTAGVDDDSLRKWREEDAGGKQVDVSAEKNRRFTSGVPQFTINGKYVVEGAQESEEFYQLFAEIAEQDDQSESNGSAARATAVKADGC